MNEMVDRVARALCEEKLWPGAFEKEAPSNQDAWRSEARAAIAAMREPTQAMIDETSSCVAKYVWQDMIDEALKD